MHRGRSQNGGHGGHEKSHSRVNDDRADYREYELQEFPEPIVLVLAAAIPQVARD